VVIYRALLELALVVLVRDLKFARLRNLWRGVWDGFTEHLVLAGSISGEAFETFAHPSNIQASAEKQL
jgi:hypothetical protein